MAKRVLRLFRLEKKRYFKERDEGIEFLWRQPTLFRLDEIDRRNVLDRIPDEFIGLCYFRNATSPRVDAIDIVYPAHRLGAPGFEVTRLLGDRTKYPVTMGNDIEVTIRADRISSLRHLVDDGSGEINGASVLISVPDGNYVRT